jgi:ribose/xylose/arabinose/galactoside ABC-type transport system permease subunit
MNRIWSHRLFWPALTLILLLAVNASFNANFLRLEWRDGHLYGSLVDILKSASPLILVSLGMTLVIATRGIDISVGAVVAISAAVAAWMIGGSLAVVDGVATHVSRFPMWAALLAALGVALACGAWNGLLVSRIGMQPIIATLILMVAGRGAAQLVTGGQIITIYYGPYFYIGNGYLLGLPFPFWIAIGVLLALLLLTRRTALGLFLEAVGVNPSAAHLAGVPAGRIKFWVYAFCGLCRGRRPGRQLHREKRRREQRRPAHGAGCHPRRHPRRDRAHRRSLQPGGQRDRSLDHPDAHLCDLLAGRAARGESGCEGSRGLRRHAVAVGRIPPHCRRVGPAPGSRMRNLAS